MQTEVIHRPEIPYDTEDPVMISQINDEMQSFEHMTVVGRCWFAPGRGMGSERFVLNVGLDTEFRYRCE